MTVHQTFHEPYPLPREEVTAVLRKWMRGEDLSVPEAAVVEYVNTVNVCALRDQMPRSNAETLFERWGLR